MVECGQIRFSMQTPKRHSDDCLERAAYAWSHTAHDINRLYVQVPETIVSGKTADISLLAQFKRYAECIIFRDTLVMCPDDAMS